MGERNLFGHQDGGGASSGKLRHGDSCDPIGVDLFATRDERYRTGVRGLEKVMRETILHRIYLEKQKPSLQS